MTNTNGTRPRIGLKKPVVAAPESITHHKDSLYEFFGVEKPSVPVNALSSARNVLQLIEGLKNDRAGMNKVEFVAFSDLIKTLDKCHNLEKKLQGFGLVGSRSPKAFLSSIEVGRDESLKYDSIKAKKEAAEKAFDDFVEAANNSEPLDNKSAEEVSKFKSELQQLISLKENYHFAECTNGFFCYEVLAAYHTHLKESYEKLVAGGAGKNPIKH